MERTKAIFIVCLLFSSLSFSQGSYTLVVEGFDWGPSVNKVILHLDEPIKELGDKFDVRVTRALINSEEQISPSQGARSVMRSFISNSSGEPVDKGKFITLILEIGPDMKIASPFHYNRGNQWVNYKMSITNESTLQNWNHEADRIIPIVDDFNLNGEFLMSSNSVMNYAYYSPPGNTSEETYPLIIWLHGGGEGGNDPTIPLLGNLATNYASDQIQQIFGGSYVLVPQSPTRWMDSGAGPRPTSGEVDDIYFKELKGLFDKFIQEHPNIDKDRIYVGGCSNGGYMSLKLLIEYPKYFTAAFISALAYKSTYLSDRQLESIKDIPIWFVHSKDDSTTKPDETVVPVYNRLMAAGSKNVHFTFYDHVIDIRNVYGGESYQYPGHWSWIYLHANKSSSDFDGKPVKVKGMPVTIMQWLASQKK